jgi:phenol hydroxylase P3 protein
MWAKMEKEGKRFYNMGLPQLCQVCQIPMGFTEVSKGDPMQISYRSSTYNNENFHMCSDGCKDIFDHEPEKYTHAWLPVHQIFQGNCGGAEIPDVMKWYHMKPEDGGDFCGSEDEAHWKFMKGESQEPANKATT